MPDNAPAVDAAANASDKTPAAPAPAPAAPAAPAAPPAPAAPAATPVEKAAEVTVTASAWAAGNGPLQVQLAGLLATDPSLRDASLAPSEWKSRLDEHQAAPAEPTEES